MCQLSFFGPMTWSLHDKGNLPPIVPIDLLIIWFNNCLKIVDLSESWKVHAIRRIKAIRFGPGVVKQDVK